MNEDSINCSECMTACNRGYLMVGDEEPAFYCHSCTRFFCGDCGFFDQHDDKFLCNNCWLNLTKGLINNERYIEAGWIFKKLGKSREHEEMKRLEMERRKKAGIDDKVIVKEDKRFIEKE